MSEWQPIETAPFMTPVRIRTAAGREFVARMVGGFLNDHEEEVPGWAEEYDDTAPPCWSDGICWERNAENEPSDPPTHWLPPPPEPPGRAGL